MANVSGLSRPIWWEWPTILSLDAPAVALVWQWAFAAYMGVTLPWYHPVLLGSVVWLIYAADRWIEGWRLDPLAVQTHRHAFYIHRRRPVFWAGLIVFTTATIVAVTHLNEHAFKSGSLLLLATLIYLLSHQLIHRDHPWRVPKEVCIGIIFAIGTALSAGLETAAPERGRLALPVALFALICFCNCVLISLWEHRVDSAHGQTSLALTQRRHQRLMHALPWLCLLLAACAGMIESAGSRPLFFCLGIAALLLAVVDLLHRRIGRRAARVLADAVLLTPLIWLAVS